MKAQTFPKKGVMRAETRKLTLLVALMMTSFLLIFLYYRTIEAGGSISSKTATVLQGKVVMNA